MNATNQNSESRNPRSAIRDPQSEIIRVLLIEDSPGYAEIVKIMLDRIADAQFDVVCARRLEEGLECLSEGETDVVLLDLKLPDSQGIDTFDRVYAKTPRVPVIVLTVTDNDEMAVGAVKKGAQDYLVKEQVDVKLLVRAIRYAIERKRVEEDLKKTNIFLRNILDSSSSISIISNDLEGNILFWNKGAENMFGYKAEEVVGRCKAGILYPEDDEETQKTIAGIRSFIVSSKQEISCEVREVTKEGHLLWINLTCTPRLDEKGHVIGILGIGEDITVRKWTEEAWISSEARLRTIIQHDVDAIIIVDRKGIMRFINPAAEILFGRKKEDLAGESFGFPVVPGEKAEIDIVRKGGGIAVAEMRTVETEWDKEPAYLVSIRDITERKRMEKELRQSEERAKAQYKGIPIPTYTWRKVDGKFVLTDYNKAAEEVTQGTMSDLLGKNVEDIYPDAPEIVEDLSKCLQQKTLIKRQAQPKPGKTSKYFDCTYAYVPPDHVMVYVEDITKEKEIDRIKSELISNVSHELRTPLTTIKEGITLVFDGSLGPISANQEAALAIAKQDIDRLARLINDLLDISKIEAGRMELKKSSMDISSLAEEVLFSFQNQAVKKHIQLKTRLQRTSPPLHIDPDRISQVLANLISNSIKFTQENGSITVGVKDTGNEVEISVADTGVGISPDNIARLFDRFSQFNRVYGPGERGTGLGLAISKEIVEMHGGRIWVESEGGEGSTLTFSLPKLSYDVIFREYLTNGLREAAEKNCPLSFVVARMKNIEKIETGHTAEKVFEILREIEWLIVRTLRRKSDIVSRYKHGEIIIAILMDTAKKNAQSVKERIGQAIEAEMHEKRWPKEMELFLGVVTYPDDAKDEAELINKISQGFWADEIPGERAAQGGKDG